MTREERAKIAAIVTLIGESYRQTITKQTIAAYELGLNDLTIEIIEQAARRAMRECKFMPTVFELRTLAGVLPPQQRATMAWASVKRAVHEVGEYKSIDFDDPVINAVIRVMGGWVNVVGIESGEKFDVWARKQFEETYVKMADSPLGEDMTRPLPGICDTDNAAKGHLKHVKPPVRYVTGIGIDSTKRLPPPQRKQVLEIASGIGDMPNDRTESTS